MFVLLLWASLWVSCISRGPNLGAAQGLPEGGDGVVGSTEPMVALSDVYRKSNRWRIPPMAPVRSGCNASVCPPLQRPSSLPARHSGGARAPTSPVSSRHSKAGAPPAPARGVVGPHAGGDMAPATAPVSSPKRSPAQKGQPPGKQPSAGRRLLN